MEAKARNGLDLLGLVLPLTVCTYTDRPGCALRGRGDEARRHGPARWRALRRAHRVAHSRAPRRSPMAATSYRAPEVREIARGFPAALGGEALRGSGEPSEEVTSARKQVERAQRGALKVGGQLGNGPGLDEQGAGPGISPPEAAENPLNLGGGVRPEHEE